MKDVTIGSEATLKREFLAIIHGFAGVVTIFYFMTAELIQACTLNIVPKSLALFWSLFANIFFFIPAVCGLLFGVLGTPLQWFDLGKELVAAFCSKNATFSENCFDFLFGIFKAVVANAWQTREREPKEIPVGGSASEYDNESWVYINGVATTSEIAKANADKMNKMFGRPVTIAYNPANGMLVDLIECIVYKTGAFHIGETKSPSRKNLIKILKRELEREDKTKVVLFAHSQGTIITGNMIEDLASDEKYAKLMLEKLEVYTFANCAHVMSKDKVRYLENIYNGRDFVAWVGQLYPFPSVWKDDEGKSINITEHKAVEEPTQWGHLLNKHYLLPMERGRFKKSYLRTYMLHRKFS